MMFGQRLDEHNSIDQSQCAVKNPQWAAPRAAQANVMLLIEPLNVFDFPDCFLACTQMALDVIRLVDHPNVGLQYDFYHA